MSAKIFCNFFVFLFKKYKYKNAKACMCQSGSSPACGTYSGMKCNGCGGQLTGTLTLSTDCLVCTMDTDV